LSSTLLVFLMMTPSATVAVVNGTRSITSAAASTMNEPRPPLLRELLLLLGIIKCGTVLLLHAATSSSNKYRCLNEIHICIIILLLAASNVRWGCNYMKPQKTGGTAAPGLIV
jgi:hypothetical protein